MAAIAAKLADLDTRQQTLRREPKRTKQQKADYKEALDEIEAERAELIRRRDAPKSPRESGIPSRPGRRAKKPLAVQDAPTGLDKPQAEQIQDVLEKVWEQSKRQFGSQQLYRTARDLYKSEGRPGTLTQKDAATFLKRDEVSQVQAPLNTFGGKTNPGLHPMERADIDLISFEKNVASKKHGGPKLVAAMQDRNSRKLYAEPIQNKDGPTVTAAFTKLLDEAKADTGRDPMEITGDLEAAFRGGAFQALLSERGIVWRPKVSNAREALSATAQLDSRIGVWREALRKARRDKKRWWRFEEEATEATNEKAVPNLRGSTPNQAMDQDNDVLQFSQQEKASKDLQASQAHADKVKGRLVQDKAFRRAVQGTAFRKGPRKGDPNWEGHVEKVDPGQLDGGMIRIENRGLFLPIGHVQPVPENSKSVDIAADPTGRPDEQRIALKDLKQAMETVLGQAENNKHTNKGMRQLIIKEMGGDEDAYKAAFRAAGLGDRFDDRARIARLAELYPKTFVRENRGLGSEAISLFSATETAPATRSKKGLALGFARASRLPRPAARG